MILSCDPGKFGAAVIFNNGLPVSFCNFNKISLHNFLIIQKTYFDEVIIENVGSRPGQNSKATFTFGRELGKLEGILEAHGLCDKIIRIYPQTWTAFYEYMFTRKDKKKSCDLVQKLFNGNKIAMDISSYDGASDALLIAYYRYRTKNP